jgi:hypothetical protein
MVTIISSQGYPQDTDILARVDYFKGQSVHEGGIFIIGKDSKGEEYVPKIKPDTNSFYHLPSGKIYSVPVGSDQKKQYPTIHFPFELRHNLSWQKIVKANKAGYDTFLSKFNLTLMDENFQSIPLDPENEDFFKYVASWGAFELAEDARLGKISNYFYGERYNERTSALETFLEGYRLK